MTILVSAARPLNIYAVICSKICEPEASRPVGNYHGWCVVGAPCATSSLIISYLQVELRLGPGRFHSKFIYPPEPSSPQTFSPLRYGGARIIRTTTPPGSIVSGPPTSPLTSDAKLSGRVVAILRVFKGFENGYPPSVSAYLTIRCLDRSWKVHRVVVYFHKHLGAERSHRTQRRAANAGKKSKFSLSCQVRAETPSGESVSSVLRVASHHLLPPSEVLRISSRT